MRRSAGAAAASSGQWAGCAGQEMLEVVADDVGPPLADAGGECRGIRGRGTELVGQRRQDELRVPERGQRHEDRPSVGIVAEQAGELDREARLAGSPWPDDREDTRVALVHERDRVEQLLLSSEERRGRARELDAPRRAQRGELALAELVDAHRAVEVLEPVLPEVAEGLRVEERRRRRRQEDLVAVREGGDARSAVDVLADVALCGRGRSARVQAHAHADRSRLEALARHPRGLRRSSGRGKRDEERVALGVDLDAAVRRRRLAHDPTVLGKRVGVARGPERVEQTRRPFDVGEEQRHRPLRKLAHGTNDDYAGAAPNQRARRVEANASFSAASSSDGPTTVRDRGRAAEEVGLDLRDAPAAELDVAVALALVAPPERLAVEPRHDVVGDDVGGVLREHARLRHRDADDVAHRVHVRERRHEVVAVDRDPAVLGEARLRDHGRHAVDRDPDEQVVGEALAALEHGLLGGRIELDDLASAPCTRCRAPRARRGSAARPPA